MAKRSTMEKVFKKNLFHCIFLTMKQKKDWLEAMPLFPDDLLEQALMVLQDNNKETDKNIKVALENDRGQKYLKGLKAKLKKIKREAFRMEEKYSQKKAEETLNKQINNL